MEETLSGIIFFIVLIYIAVYLLKTYTVAIIVIVSIIAVFLFWQYMKKRSILLDARHQRQEELRKQEEETRNKEEDIRKQEEKVRKQKEKIKKKEEDIRKRLIDEDKKYDCVINCPTCKGFGETYILRRYYDDEDNDRGETNNWKMQRSDFRIVSGSDVKCQKWASNDGIADVTNEITKGECPFCEKTGSVYAWFEKNAVWSQACEKCYKSGKLRIKEKLDVGIGEKEINCDNCNGTGKIDYSAEERVHIKTKGGWSGEQLQEDEENLLDDDRFRLGYDEPNYRKFYIIITNENRDFYAKSQPRQL